MLESIEYIQDVDGTVWRVNYEEGFAESFPASFADLGLNPDTIKYNGKIDNYLRDMGVYSTKYMSDQNRWTF